MYRLPAKTFKALLIKPFAGGKIEKFNLHRCFATLPVEDVLFPTKSDFPSRHIGPRKTDVVTMLDTIGFKV